MDINIGHGILIILVIALIVLIYNKMRSEGYYNWSNIRYGYFGPGNATRVCARGSCDTGNRNLLRSAQKLATPSDYAPPEFSWGIERDNHKAKTGINGPNSGNLENVYSSNLKTEILDYRAKEEARKKRKENINEELAKLLGASVNEGFRARKNDKKENFFKYNEYPERGEGGYKMTDPKNRVQFGYPNECVAHCSSWHHEKENVPLDRHRTFYADSENNIGIKDIMKNDIKPHAWNPYESYSADDKFLRANGMRGGARDKQVAMANVERRTTPMWKQLYQGELENEERKEWWGRYDP